MKKFDLSICIISFNTKEITKACLESILRNTRDLSYEIILIENGSKDGSLAMLRQFSKKHPHIRLINAGKNLGFGRADNWAAKKAQGEYLLFLNSDTLVFENSLRDALNIARSRPEAGAYSCRLLNADHSFQPSGGHFPNLVNLLAWQFFIDDLPFLGKYIPSYHPQKSQYDRNKKMDWVTGAFFMIKKDYFDTVGGFDRNIFMYTEEMELCYRLSERGYKTFYSNTPAIIHLGGASGGSYLALTSEIRNIIYFWQKHKPVWQMPIVKISLWLGSLLRLLIFGIIKGDAKSRKAYFHALGFIF